MGKYWEDLVEHLILSAGVATMLLGLWLTTSFGGIGYDFWTASTLESTKEVIKLKDKQNKDIPYDETANVFCKHFEQKLNQNSSAGSSNVFGVIKNEFPSRDFSANPRDFLEAIRDLNDKLSCGFDEISNKLLKLCPEQSADLICTLAKSIFQLNYWPRPFKTAKAIVLYKKGNKFEEKVIDYLKEEIGEEHFVTVAKSYKDSRDSAKQDETLQP